MVGFAPFSREKRLSFDPHLFKIFSSVYVNLVLFLLATNLTLAFLFVAIEEDTSIKANLMCFSIFLPHCMFGWRTAQYSSLFLEQ